jgi:translin
VDLDGLAGRFQERFDRKMVAREAALAASRRAIRSSANAIRAIHRGETETAGDLMEQARASVEEAKRATEDHPDLLYAGYVQDAQKEYAEARVTERVVLGGEVPGPDEIGVQDAPYLNGVAEAIGETRRTILDHLRKGDVARGEELLQVMDDLYSLLVTIDYPDAITGNLRRSTDVARSIMEKTRGDLSMALVQRGLRDALEQHARELHGSG